MIEINDKVLLTTDWHFGLANNSISRLNILVQVVKHITKVVKENNIKYIIFLGDLFHNRNTIDSRVLNIAIKCIDMLTKYCKIYMILGNHDLYNKNSTEINSVNIFKNTKNVIIIDKATDISLYSKKGLLIPWLTDMSQYKNSSYDLLFGHFEIDPKYLMNSYIEQHKNNSSLSNTDKAELDTLLGGSSSKVDDTIGDFVLKAKTNGIIFSGHIHNHREFTSNKRKFIFIGSPYQQNLGEINTLNGYYILDTKDKINCSFFEIPDIPKHIDIKMSNVVKAGIDNYDFSIIKNNIVHKIYDIDVDRVLDAKISQRIQDWKPYEELTPDYDVQISYEENGKVINESVDIIKKSKLEYIHNYISNMDQKILDTENIEADKLYKIMADYYQIVTDGK